MFIRRNLSDCGESRRSLYYSFCVKLFYTGRAVSGIPWTPGELRSMAEEREKQIYRHVYRKKEISQDWIFTLFIIVCFITTAHFRRYLPHFCFLRTFATGNSQHRLTSDTGGCRASREKLVMKIDIFFQTTPEVQNETMDTSMGENEENSPMKKRSDSI